MFCGAGRRRTTTVSESLVLRHQLLWVILPPIAGQPVRPSPIPRCTAGRWMVMGSVSTVRPGRAAPSEKHAAQPELCEPLRRRRQERCALQLLRRSSRTALGHCMCPDDRGPGESQGALAPSQAGRAGTGVGREAWRLPDHARVPALPPARSAAPRDVAPALPDDQAARHAVLVDVAEVAEGSAVGEPQRIPAGQATGGLPRSEDPR